MDFTSFFKQYEALVHMAQGVFDRVRGEYGECVKCKLGCDDCCYALFDLTLVEAMYINHHFKNTYRGEERDRLIEAANRADREVYKIKKRAFRELNEGKNEDLLIVEMAGERVKCALLNDEKKCSLYEYRPITCRLYGIPISIGGVGYTCGISGFLEGTTYPTVNMDPIIKQLFKISGRLVASIQSQHVRMAEMLVPLSMALLTDYDETYLGVVNPKKAQEDEEENGS